MSARRRLRSAAVVLLAVVAVAGPAAPTSAETVIRSDVDARRVGLDDLVQLTIMAEGSPLPDAVPMPALSNLRLAGGPSVSTQMSFVNGRMSHSRSWTYALQPVAVGPAEVGPVSARPGSAEPVAPAIPIEIVPGSVKPRPQARRAVDPFDQDPFADLMGRGRTVEPRLFVEVKASRPSLFVGEPLLLTYYLYTETSVTGVQFGEAPQYTGFWAEDLEQAGQPRGDPATVDGVRYARFPVMTKLLYPTRSGRLTIPSATIKVGIARQSFFDAGGVVERATRAITVEVKPIPDEPGFSGAVGRFKATAAVDRASLAFGEAATLRFKVEGSGNLKWIERGPEVTVPGARVYPPQVKSDLRTRPEGIAGSRTWEFVVVPQTTGALEIPALSFSYFDPAAGRIARSATAPVVLRVEGGTAATLAPPIAGARPVTRAGPLPLRADLERRPTAGMLSGRAVGVVVAGALLLHGLLWGGDWIGRRGHRVPGRAAASRSVRQALGDLQRVGRDTGSKEKAAGRIEQAIHDVFGSLDGDDSERARAVAALLDEVHEVRYAPQLGDYSEKLRELATRAGDLVRRWA